MAFNFALPLRIAQAVLAVITLGLTAYVIHWWSHYYYAFSPSQINFLLFSSLWSLLALGYLMFAPRLATSGSSNPIWAHKFVVLGVESLTMLFWFAGFIALAVFLSDRVCYGHVCNAAKAAAVFAAFEWVLFTATTVMAALHVVRTRGLNNKSADPNMSMHPGV
ncbi:hypothetical protein H2203_009111 [Taxawa tesnikishii (nom. ined.)]|nr:hypothetical protein H2203_009111 [Dothideales sp. JES 119]